MFLSEHVRSKKIQKRMMMIMTGAKVNCIISKYFKIIIAYILISQFSCYLV
uniref:Uncharacterized protein n=1 Tax=Anguilla anguilla TaxID=7936 RepID=A0A0E9TZK0_ANGAN